MIYSIVAMPSDGADKKSSGTKKGTKKSGTKKGTK